MHIIGLSGGKDSTALALRLAEIDPRPYRYICNETGNELPAMRAHWARLEGLLGAPIERVRHTRGLVEESRAQGILPSVFARWCTRILKIEPTIAFMRRLPPGAVLYDGLRADEEDRPGLYSEGITVRHPLREWGWGLPEVVKYLEARGVCIPKRTDCALCPFQRLGEWRDLYEQHPELYALGVQLEQEVTEARGKVATFRPPGRDTWPASLAELAKEFDRGRKLREGRKAPVCRVCSM